MGCKLTEEQIDKAANWWADRVCAPVFSGLSAEERKDKCNDGYQMAEVFATLLVKPVTDDQRAKFIAALKEELNRPGYWSFSGSLNVDYDPCRELAEAAKAAGISTYNFPWKSSTYFNRDGTVEAVSGYGIPAVKL